MGLAQLLTLSHACLQSLLSHRPKFRFGPEYLINSTLFAAGGNITLELISN